MNIAKVIWGFFKRIRRNKYRLTNRKLFNESSDVNVNREKNKKHGLKNENTQINTFK